MNAPFIFQQDFQPFPHSIDAINHPHQPPYHTSRSTAPIDLSMVVSSTYLPKENDRNPKGDDAHFFCTAKKTIGIADGVGGWAKHGIDAGQYARDLLTNAEITVYNQPEGYVDPKRVLWEAYLKTRVQGSSTACVITLSGNILQAAIVGDSGFIIVRDGVAVYRSPVQRRGNNCPYQLGICRDDPSSAEEVQVVVEEGDIVVAGTDGLFDNMHTQEIEEVLRSRGVRLGSNIGMELDDVATMIANLALYNSFDRFADTPYSMAAKAAGKSHRGGKIDDITVIVSYITLAL